MLLVTNTYVDVQLILSARVLRVDGEGLRHGGSELFRRAR